MKLFKVRWEIHVDAETHEEAARKAKEIQIDPDPDAINNFFEVVEMDNDEAKFQVVDLDLLDGKFGFIG